MQDYTPEGMLKRIEQLEAGRIAALQIIELQQKTLDNVITILEDLKPRVNQAEATLDNHNERLGNLEYNGV